MVYEVFSIQNFNLITIIFIFIQYNSYFEARFLMMKNKIFYLTESGSISACIQVQKKKKKFCIHIYNVQKSGLHIFNYCQPFLYE